jgi:predicted small lipoprotein YifL
MKTMAMLALVAALAACGDKVPESKAAREVGNVPKQTVDRATTGVDNAMQQGADRMKDADKKE